MVANMHEAVAGKSVHTSEEDVETLVHCHHEGHQRHGQVVGVGQGGGCRLAHAMACRRPLGLPCSCGTYIREVILNMPCSNAYGQGRLIHAMQGSKHAPWRRARARACFDPSLGRGVKSFGHVERRSQRPCCRLFPIPCRGQIFRPGS